MKKIILRADIPNDKNERKNIVTEGLEAGITDFILRKNDGFEKLGLMNPIYLEDEENVFEIIDGTEKMDALMSLKNKKRIIVESKDWTVIPLENLIARYDGTETDVYVSAKTKEDAVLFLTVLEKGVDGIVVMPEFLKNFEKKNTKEDKISLKPVKVKSVKQLEIGDRVCVDTCTMMIPGEGMLIGSQSNCLFLIQSESEENEYVAKRPFRVNAGSVHSYVLMPDLKTCYLSELEGGEQALICDRSGKTKTSSVGRCKLEKRPLVMVSFENGASVILQNAETVKFVCEKGSCSVAEIKPGMEVLAHISEGGRHFGMKVDETVSEK